MSSETSTSAVRLKADATEKSGVGLQPDQGLQPWQFFVLAALGCATAVTFIARGRGATSVILLSVLMAAVALVGVAALRMLRPLVSPDDDRTVVIGKRTRAAMEREKMLALRSIKELEFDRAMGKLSDEDWREMSTRLRARAARLMRQLDAGEGYRSQIERELEKRLGDAALKGPRYDSADRAAADTDAVDRRAALSGPRYDSTDRAAADTDALDRRAALSGPPTVERVCASCSTVNDSDARFCKNCGTAL